MSNREARGGRHRCGQHNFQHFRYYCRQHRHYNLYRCSCGDKLMDSLKKNHLFSVVFGHGLEYGEKFDGIAKDV